VSIDYDDVMVSLGLEPSTPKRVPAEHGEPRGYSNGCRCTKCREAWRRYQADWRASKRRDKDALTRVKHGTTTTYRAYGCRCEACRAANTAAMAAYRARHRKPAAKGGDAR